MKLEIDNQPRDTARISLSHPATSSSLTRARDDCLSVEAPLATKLVSPKQQRGRGNYGSMCEATHD